MAPIPHHVRAILRNHLRRSVREYFDRRGYCEVDTPLAVLCPGTETHLRYFKTEWVNYKNQSHTLYLRSSPEIHMKQLLAKDLPKIYQIAPCFRNFGENSEWHHPEFSMLEWYEASLSFESFMLQIEEFLNETSLMMREHLDQLGLDSSFSQKRISLARISVYEAFKDFVGIELVDQDPELGRKGINAGLLSPKINDDFETAFFKILIERIEPNFERIGPLFFYDYPPSQAALSLVRGGKAKRVEVYFGRVELSNGFEELVDSKCAEHRYDEAQKQRLALGYESPELDMAFLKALEETFLPSCGNALGFDRWLALLCGDTSVDRVIPFRNAKPFSHSADF